MRGKIGVRARFVVSAGLRVHALNPMRREAASASPHIHTVLGIIQMRPRRPRDEKPLHWVGSSKKDLLGFPEAVVDNIGYALGVVQLGGHPLG